MVGIAFGCQCVGFKSMNVGGLWAGLLLSVLSVQLFAAPEIVASGLFKDKALLTIDGQPHMLKVGASSPEGVKLLSSDSQQATVLVAGQTLTLFLSERVSTSFKKPEFTEVKIRRNSNGHYFAAGAINGRSVAFMVDTGATTIAMNMNEARRLGIDFRKARLGMSSTAGGLVETFRVVLDKVSVGNVTLYRIPASVMNGEFPEHILLGNSFLSKVQMSEQSGVLVLRKRY